MQGKDRNVDKPLEKKIVVSKNGPYLVSGGIPISMQTITPNKEGFSWDWTEGRTFDAQSSEYALCRCGQSKNKPFCDGTHEKIGFEGKETATRKPYVRQAKKYDGPTMVLSDAENLCAFARFCDPEGQIWNLIEQTDNPAARDLVIREANHCPAGRLVVHDKKTAKGSNTSSLLLSGWSKTLPWDAAGHCGFAEAFLSNLMTASGMKCAIA